MKEKENEDLRERVKELEAELEFLKDENQIFQNVNAEIDSLKSENTSLKTQLEDSSKLIDLSGTA